jgi:hypothetical protein
VKPIKKQTMISLFFHILENNIPREIKTHPSIPDSKTMEKLSMCLAL